MKVSAGKFFEKQDGRNNRILGGLILILLILSAAWLFPLSDYDVDSHFYVDISTGNLASVNKPFSNRILHATVASLLSTIQSIGTSTSFTIISLAALVTFVTVMSVTLKNLLPLGGIIALIAVPMVVKSFQEIYLPDLFHLTLLSILFLCLRNEKIFLSLLVLLLLHLTRKSTVVLTLFLVVTSFFRQNWKLFWGGLFAGILGLSIVNYMTSFGAANVHALNDLTYFIAKVPYNLLKNIFGLVMWTDSLAVVSPDAFPNAPLWSVQVPRWIPSGDIHSIGFYQFDPIYVLNTFKQYITLFGVLPFIALLFLSNKRSRDLLIREHFSQLACLYGGTSFLIAPMLGASVARLIGYGWPLFWIALPLGLSDYFLSAPRSYMQILAISWLTSLLSILVFRNSVPLALFVFSGSLLINLFVYRSFEFNSEVNPQ